MPNQPNKRHQQETGRLWRPPESTGRFPAQPPYRDHRGTNTRLSWSELDRLPAGRSTRRGLTAL
ncbi:DNA repair protein [Micromonospora fluostatini]|uniref:DNA repair protein n=1 Tax=Micromonospora fluostatini TaxID=1629071 RepID=A0ABY2DDL3_9ACTN|nr:DNA repair protein [Micromonospora fluostatini]